MVDTRCVTQSTLWWKTQCPRSVLTANSLHPSSVSPLSAAHVQWLTSDCLTEGRRIKDPAITKQFSKTVKGYSSFRVPIGSAEAVIGPILRSLLSPDLASSLPQVLISEHSLKNTCMLTPISEIYLWSDNLSPKLLP